MKVSNFFILMAAWVLPSLAFAQDTLRVNLNYRVKDDVYDKTQAIVPVFKYTGDSLEEFTRFGTVQKTTPRGFKITLPDLHGCQDTAYGFLFFTGMHRDINNGYRLMVIGNYTRRLPAVIYTDKNDNFDLSDDGPADTFTHEMYSLDLVLRNPDVQEGKYIVKLSYFAFNQGNAYKMMLTEHFKENSGPRKFAGADYSFREQRLNILAGDYNNGTDSFRIALQDANCNGRFDDPGLDKLYVTSFKEPELVEVSTRLDEKHVDHTVFEWDFKQYKVMALDPAGKWITCKVVPDARLKTSLAKGKKAPKFSFRRHDEVVKKIRRYRCDWVYLYFWNTSQPGLETDTAILRTIQNRYADKITIIALNYGDNISGLERFVKFSGANWINGLSTIDINRLYHIQQMPIGFVLKTRNRLVKSKVTPAELLNQLQTGQKLKKMKW